MFRRIAPLLLLFIILPLSLTACGGDEPPSFQATSSKDDVDIRSAYADGVLTFSIFSPSGIGDASIVLTEGKMPKTVQIRLFLDGLENLEVKYDDVTIVASVATSGGGVMQKVVKGETETEIDATSPYWLDIQPLPAKPGGVFIGEPMLPASFLITMPPDFHQSGATRFDLRWIDFYR